jgi:hypothetical protein
MREQLVRNRLFVGGMRIAIALLLVVSGLLAFGTAPVFALDPVQTVHVDGGHILNYYGAEYDAIAGQTTFFYSVTSGSSPALSHIVMELECPPPVEVPFVILDAGTWGYPDKEALNSGAGSPVPSEFPAFPARDASTGTVGIKFDQGLSAGETLYFYFTLEGGFPPGWVRFVIKAGTSEPEAYVQGPGCVAPGAVTVSSFEVQRENDTLRFKWATETELNNLGFDLFAVEPGSSTRIKINDTFIFATGVGQITEPQSYYYQVDRPGLAIGAEFYLRARETSGKYDWFGPVQAIYSAPIMPPIAPALPTVPTDRPIVEPRTEPVLLPEPLEREEPAVPPVLPIKELIRPVPVPVIPRIDNSVRPGPIVGSRF